ncbi:MAG TPA: peptidoglycan bridge formation glycyltransferase FemA/FemB family protein [Patescibacteria group bacterium]|nr:peptidoglycan bridge formation glycyltransferase FemA/FemB family protein [Patescibacteria group bacterium]
MEIKHIDANRHKEWNAFAVQQPFFALFQSWEWGEVKEKLGWKAFRVSVEEKGEIIAAAQLFIRSFPLGLPSIAYIPRGPIGNWLDPEVSSLLFSEIHHIARSYRAVFLKIEPPALNNPTVAQLLQQHNFRSSYATLQPCSTIIIDLRPDQEILFEQIRKSTRRKIKDAARKGVSIRTGSQEDLSAFYRLMQITGKRAGFTIHPFHYYLNEWQTLVEHGRSLMLMAFYQDQLLAVNIIYCFGPHAAFFHQASSNEYKNLNPNSLLVWEGIKWLKGRDYCAYDLWGISDEIGQIVSQGDDLPGHERTDGLWGVYQFKSGFSKNIVYYIGAYDFVYRPFLYKITSSIFFSKNLERFSIGIEWIRRYLHLS